TTGLDPGSRVELWGTIEELVADGTTLLLTTQNLEEADRLSDSIAVVDHGRVIADGTASELKSQFGATVIEVKVGAGVSIDEVKSALSEVGPTYIADRRTIEVKVTEGGVALLQVVRLLDAANVPVEAVAIREPSLDDVFLQLTGRRATPSADEPEEVD